MVKSTVVATVVPLSIVASYSFFLLITDKQKKRGFETIKKQATAGSTAVTDGFSRMMKHAFLNGNVVLVQGAAVAKPMIASSEGFPPEAEEMSVSDTSSEETSLSDSSAEHSEDTGSNRDWTTKDGSDTTSVDSAERVDEVREATRTPVECPATLVPHSIVKSVTFESMEAPKKSATGSTGWSWKIALSILLLAFVTVFQRESLSMASAIRGFLPAVTSQADEQRFPVFKVAIASDMEKPLKRVVNGSARKQPLKRRYDCQFVGGGPVLVLRE